MYKVALHRVLALALGLGVLVGCSVPLRAAAAPGDDTASKNIQLSADSFEVDAKKNLLIAQGHVVVNYRDIVMTGASAIYFKNDQVVQLTGNILVRRDTMTMNCDMLKAYDREDRIEVSGNVKFALAEMRGVASAGVYDHSAQTIRLSGDPKVWQNRDQITGKLITVDIRRSKVLTSGGARAVFSADKFSSR